MINNINKYFKQTMDRFKIKGTELSKEFGCGQSYISDIRVGKCNPPTNRLWELIETMEKLAPGARRYFGNLVAGNDTTYFLEAIAKDIEPSEMIEMMDNEQLAKFMLALAVKLGKELKNQKKSEQTETEQTEEDLMLIG